MDKVITMIDEMIALCGKQQIEDDNKKEYCLGEIDKTEDTIKELKLDVGDLEKVIEEVSGTITTMGEEIKTLEDEIVKLDRSVAGATFQRKEEHADFKASQAANQGVIKILEFAKNRLQ